jgi:hypothetical protein
MPDPQNQAPDPRKDPLYSPREQTFEVVCLKKDVSDGAALPEHFKRITVRADSPYKAQMDPEVAKQSEGYRVLYAALPGVLTDMEILARQRQINAATADTRKYLDGDPPRR